MSHSFPWVLCSSVLPLPFKGYSLRPKKLVILGFKIYPKKQVILPYLESACARKNQLVLNMGT